MPSPAADTLRQRLQDSLRRQAPTLTNIAGVGGLALLAVSAALPLITGGFSLATLVTMLGAAGGNAFAAWLQTWAEQASGLDAVDEQQLAVIAADLQSHLEQSSDLAAAVEALLRQVDAIPVALGALSQQGEQQARLLQMLLEDTQGNAVRAERLLNLVLDAQQHSDARNQALLEQLRADVQAISTREATSTAIRITDSAGATVNNRGIIAGRDVVNVVLPQAAPITPEQLAAALALLDTLPTDDDDPIPTPQPLSVPHHMDLVSNPYFVGREDDLRRVARTLKDGQTCAVTTGIGGIGKTQLAVEFARRYGRFFAGGVFWLTFADATAIAGEVAACGGQDALNLFLDAAQLEQKEKVKLVRAAWEQPLPRLLIFDNCEDPQLLRDWKPQGGGCRVLMTSRTTSWPGTLGVQRVALDVLPRAESMHLLLRYRSDLAPDAAIDALCDEVGDLPLALHLLGSFLEVYHDDPLLGYPTQLLADLRSGPILSRANELAQDVSDSPTKHDLDVARSFALSYRQLDGDEPVLTTARALIARAAYLAPGELIPRDLLLATLALPAGDVAAQRQTARALGRLTGLGLLEGEEGGVLRLHRLIAAFVQSETGDATALEMVEAALTSAAYVANQSGLPAQMQPILPHLRHATERVQRRDDERALAIREQTLGPTHPDTAGSLNNLAALLDSQGEYAAARPLYERALAIREQTLGPTHPSTATSLNNLAGLLRAQGDYAIARPLYERALAIREQTLGPTHPDTAGSLNNLAGLLESQGDYAIARPLYERALTITEQTLGPTHPDTAGSLNNLAIHYYYQQLFVEALPLMQRAFAIFEHFLGQEHPSTISARQTLAVIEQAAQQQSQTKTREQQITRITQQAEQAVAQSLSADAETRAQLIAQLEAVAQQAADGQTDGSPYLALAAHLRSLAAQLRAVDAT